MVPLCLGPGIVMKGIFGVMNDVRTYPSEATGPVSVAFCWLDSYIDMSKKEMNKEKAFFGSD